MNEHSFKTVGITSIFSDSIKKSIRNTIPTISQPVHNLKWFEITQIRRTLNSNHIAQWQDTLKPGFR
ncbi:MAG: hypothetical protein GX640_18990 [Fibrobacter sp.]|nr:hypothetical protein [Fibrobacter sp.]